MLLLHNSYEISKNNQFAKFYIQKTLSNAQKIQKIVLFA